MTSAADDVAVPPASPAINPIKRVRHETRRRTLTVSAAADLTPSMRRITLQSDDLAGFVSLSADDHIKLFFQGADRAVVMRDYTPRSFDVQRGELVIDFALHGVEGPATQWAQSASVGDTLEIGGPRGSAIISESFDWYLLIGDETALPAIGRRLEEMPPSTQVTTVIVVDQHADQQAIKTAARWQAEWIIRSAAGGSDVQAAMLSIDRLLPHVGVGFVWIAGEAQFARTLRAHLIDRRGHPPTHMKAAGYWVLGSAGAHESLD